MDKYKFRGKTIKDNKWIYGYYITFILENGEEITLTFEEARKLYQELNELFNVREVYVPYYPCNYPYYPLYPIVTYCYV